MYLGACRPFLTPSTSYDTLAGIAFGNSGVHVPHGMAYSVAGLVHDYRVEGYPQDKPMVPHGMSVIVIVAPAVFRFTASACPQRHLHGAHCIGTDVKGATDEDVNEILAGQLIRMMQDQVQAKVRQRRLRADPA